MHKEKVILDVDTGTDDAIAVALAMLSGALDILGICTVNGNLELRLTTDNTLRVVDYLDMGDRVPVIRGCELPIASTLLPWSPQSTGIMTAYTKEDNRCIPRREGARTGKNEMHSEHIPLPETKLQPLDKSAVVWLIETLLASEDHSITLIITGPLTNIGVALRADPRIVSKIKRIVLMGGGHHCSNRTPAAEFNVWADPEAAEIVMQSGCDITCVSLDATHAACITSEQAEQLRTIGTKEASFVATLIETRIQSRASRGGNLPGVPVHDAVAVCAVLCPEVLTEVVECNCHVDISGGYAYGRTIIDSRQKLPREPVNCKFALNADGQRFFQWMKTVLENHATERRT